MHSKEARQEQTFLRNEYRCTGKWNIPMVEYQPIVGGVKLIACSDTKSREEHNRECGVHFFVDDYRFEHIYDYPHRSLRKLSQYKFLLTPDYSLYADMPLWRQIENVAKNRWCGAYWQAHGLTVYPTVSWGLAPTYDFCFDGVEKNAVVAVGMIGCKRNKLMFMRGYDAMLERLEPQAIICFGSPFAEMRGNIIPVDYLSSRKVVR